MIRFLTRVLINTAAIVVAAAIVPGIVVRDVPTAIIAGLILGVINAFVRPILLVLTLPLTLLSLGLFLVVLNAICLGLAAWLVPGFQVQGFLPALIGALFISIVSWLLTAFLANSK